MAKRVLMSSWPAARTFTPKTPELSMTSWVKLAWFAQTSTSGGCAETLEKALTVIP